MRNESHTVPLTTGSVKYIITRRRNQKYINLRISLEGELVVSAPFGVSLARIKESLVEKERWIARNLQRANEHRAVNDPMRQVLLRGVPLLVRTTVDPRRRRVVRIDEDDRTLEVITSETSATRVIPILESYLVRQARTYFPRRVAELSAMTGIPYERLFIRNQRTRWGSSSGRGNLSVNWRAIMAPPTVQDYLIIHELAHQVHLNHSKAFWKVVERWYPDYRGANRWLKNHSVLMSLFR